MKKYLVYIGILVLGLILGSLFFGKSTTNETAHNHNEETQTNQMWTCSMHPQIMKSESGDCPICGMDLIPATTSADGLAAGQFKLTKNAMALANLQTSIVGTGKAENNVFKLSGKIVENENTMAVQTAHFAGRIESFYINSVGEKINRGQLLARIYSPELFAAQQELLTASALKETQLSLYNAVRSKLKLWKLSDKQINSIEASKKPISNFPVYANVSGIVTEKLVEEGSHVMEGAPLLKTANLSTVWANFDVYENQISFFKKGQDISITTNAYANKTFKAKVSFIDPVLDSKTRTVKLRAVLNNKNNIFKPGMFVEGKINGLKIGAAQTIIVPSTAVLWTGERSVIYLKANPNEPVFEMREVKLGNTIGENYEVLDGLNNGDEIVTNGTFTVDAAAQLQGKKSMMNKSGGKTMTGHEEHLGVETTNTASNTDHSTMNERIKVSSKFQEQLKRVFKNYVNLKDALVNDDSKNAKKAAKTTIISLDKIDMKLLSDKNAHNHWMKLENEIKASANSIASETEIKEQRNHFKHLSSHLTTAVEIFGINQKVFNQFCPMADSNKGAYWLSKEEKILNPYFGKAMHNCGSVTQTIE